MTMGIREMKMHFFDRDVMDASDKQSKEVASKFGAFVRSDAQRSMRTAKSGKPAPPGKPPRVRKGFLKKFLFFAWDPNTRSVVIGPARFGGMTGEIPEALEDGGNVAVRKDTQVVTVHLHRHPFMGPAAEKNKPKLPSVWRNSVVKG